jgi:hypothetical protein
VPCLYPAGPDLPDRRIARELGLPGPDARLMTERLRHGLAAGTPAATPEGEVAIGAVHAVAGRKGRPAAVAEGGVPADAGG